MQADPHIFWHKLLSWMSFNPLEQMVQANVLLQLPLLACRLDFASFHPRQSEKRKYSRQVHGSNETERLIVSFAQVHWSPPGKSAYAKIYVGQSASDWTHHSDGRSLQASHKETERKTEVEKRWKGQGKRQHKQCKLPQACRLFVGPLIEPAKQHVAGEHKASCLSPAADPELPWSLAITTINTRSSLSRAQGET